MVTFEPFDLNVCVISSRLALCLNLSKSHTNQIYYIKIKSVRNIIYLDIICMTGFIYIKETENLRAIQPRLVQLTKEN